MPIKNNKALAYFNQSLHYDCEHLELPEAISHFIETRTSSIFEVISSMNYAIECEGIQDLKVSIAIWKNKARSVMSLADLTFKDGTKLSAQFASGRGITWISKKTECGETWRHSAPFVAWNEVCAMFDIDPQPSWFRSTIYGYGYATTVSECFGSDGEPVSVLSEPKLTMKGHKIYDRYKSCPIVIMPLPIIAPSVALQISDADTPTTIVLIDASHEKSAKIRKRCSLLLNQVIKEATAGSEAVVSLFDKKGQNVSFEETSEAIQRSIDEINAYATSDSQVSLVLISAEELDSYMSSSVKRTPKTSEKEFEDAFINAAVYNMDDATITETYNASDFSKQKRDCTWGAIISKFQPNEGNFGLTSARNSTALCRQLVALEAVPSDIDKIICFKASNVSPSAAKEISKTCRILYSDVLVDNTVYSKNEISRSKASFFVFDTERFPRILPIAEESRNIAIARTIIRNMPCGVLALCNESYVGYSQKYRNFSLVASGITHNHVQGFSANPDISESDIQAFESNSKQHHPLGEVMTEYGTANENTRILKDCLTLWRHYAIKTGMQCVLSGNYENNHSTIGKMFAGVSAAFGLDTAFDAFAAGCSMEDVENMLENI